MTKTDKCRRCSECENYSHHWIPDSVPDDIGEYSCKHCDARGESCDLCEGVGGIPRDDGELDECQVCHGEGVVFVGLSVGGWVEAAAVEIVGSWDEIDGEAMQASQVAQDPQAGLDVMHEKIMEIICRNYSERVT